MYSWQVKFNNKIIYYRHLTYHIDSVNPYMVVCFGIPKNFQEHDIYFDILFVIIT